jgi:hypothetical protein
MLKSAPSTPPTESLTKTTFVAGVRVVAARREVSGGQNEHAFRVAFFDLLVRVSGELQRNDAID